MLTRKQHELLRFIQVRLEDTGISPSFEEMKEALDLKSKSGVHRLISALKNAASSAACRTVRARLKCSSNLRTSDRVSPRRSPRTMRRRRERLLRPPCRLRQTT